MIKLTYCLHRLPTLSREEFQQYWRGTHAPLVAAAREALGIRRYIQQHTVGSAVAEANTATCVQPASTARSRPRAFGVSTG